MPAAVGDRGNPVDPLWSATCARLIALVAFAALLLAPSARPVAGPPGGKTIVIGYSVRGRPIRAYERGDRSVPPTVVVGVIHGSEPAGLKVVAGLRSMPLPAGVHLWLVPTVNPDGLAAGTRQNARGVDLNRNWPAGWVPNGRPWDGYYSGPRPFSEPENRAMRAFLLRVRPALTIWYHQPLDLVYGSDPHVALLKRYARLTGLPYRRLPAPPGAATRWQRRRFPSSPAFVVEFPAGPLPAAIARRHAAVVSALSAVHPNSRPHRLSESRPLAAAVPGDSGDLVRQAFARMSPGADL